MTRSDWIGLGTSLGAHALIAGLLALLTLSPPPSPALGAVQLDVGAFAEGRPVPQDASREAAPADDETVPEKEDAAASATPEDAQSASPSEEPPTPAEQGAPLDLPDQPEPTAGQEPPPEDVPEDSDQQEAPPAPPSEAQEPPAGETSSAETAPAGGSAAANEADGAEDAAASGEEGAGDEAERAAPFDIEGLDRTRLHGPLPRYTEKVSATIQVEITVGPRGQVVGQRLLRKASPALERSVMEALRQWRFNRLPAGAPQQTQTGVVTFRFRLE